MAGSLNRYKYESDDGGTYALKCDRSNANAVNTALEQASATDVGIPNNISPRFVLYRSTNGKVTRKCYIMSPLTSILGLPETYAVAVAQSGATTVTVTLRRSFYSGEKYGFVGATDTGLDDTDTASEV